MVNSPLIRPYLLGGGGIGGGTLNSHDTNSYLHFFEITDVIHLARQGEWPSKSH